MSPRVVTATNAEVLSNSQADERQQDQSPIKLPSKCDGSVPWKEEHSQGDDLKDDNNVTKDCPNERVSKYIKSEAESFSPNIKYTSEQVRRAIKSNGGTSTSVSLLDLRNGKYQRNF